MYDNNFLGKNNFIWFNGVVEDRNDPQKLGRLRVRCVGIHTDNTTYNSSTYQFVVKTNNINAGITLHSLSSGQGAVLFTDTGGGSAQGQIRYDHVNNQINFFANSPNFYVIFSKCHVLIYCKYNSSCGLPYYMKCR